MNLKETLTTLIIMILILAITLLFNIDFDNEPSGISKIEDAKAEYCNNAYNALPYDEFIREIKANNIVCH